MKQEKHSVERNQYFRIDLKEKIIEHERTFRVRERQCGWNGASGRMYLLPELTIKHMHELFLQIYPNFAKFKYSYCYEVFRSQFNIGIGTIKKDTCSTLVKKWVSF